MLLMLLTVVLLSVKLPTLVDAAIVAVAATLVEAYVDADVAIVLADVDAAILVAAATLVTAATLVAAATVVVVVAYAARVALADLL